jgi:wyosine [tRNA(Phe)-imidazoG37] synthetase (radical SAM superfamily)
LSLGKIIVALKRFRIPIAVISNASLIDRPDVQEELFLADWVSLKVDSVDETTWRKIDRPHRQLSLPDILDGMLMFQKNYHGELVTESMLVAGLNDGENSARQLCDFLLELQPFKSYLSIPTRPPAEPGITPPSPDSLQQIIQICSAQISFMDLLFETEVGEFVSTGDLAEDILSITAVHPLREEALRTMVSMAGGAWSLVEELITKEEITSINYRDERFFLRHFKKLPGRSHELPS